MVLSKILKELKKFSFQSKTLFILKIDLDKK